MSEKSALLGSPPPYYQVVPQNNQPIPNQNREHPDQGQCQHIPPPPLRVHDGRQQADKKFMISAIFIGVSMVLTGFWAALCLIPVFYCYFQANNERDPDRKDKLMKKVVCGSAVVLVISIIVAALLLTFFISIIAITAAGSGS